MPEPLLIPGGNMPWSWSVRRSMLTGSCLRRLFLYYYGSRGGHDPANAPERVRHLHLLKQLIPAQTYFRELLAGELRRMFYQESGESFRSGRRNTADALSGLLLRKCRRDCSAMVSGQYRQDHRLPVIDAVHFNTIPVNQVIAEIENSIHRFINSEEAAENLDRIFAVSPARRIAVARPLPVYLGASTLFCTPVLAYRSQSGIVFIDLCRGGAVGMRHECSVMLQCYHALTHLRTAPDRVIPLFWDEVSGRMTELPAGEVNFSTVQDHMASDRSVELSLCRDDGSFCESDFKQDKRFCSGCNFKEECFDYE